MAKKKHWHIDFDRETGANVRLRRMSESEQAACAKVDALVDQLVQAGHGETVEALVEANWEAERATDAANACAAGNIKVGDRVVVAGRVETVLALHDEGATVEVSYHGPTGASTRHAVADLRLAQPAWELR